VRSATWGDLRKFLKADGWRLDRTTGDAHDEKLLPDGALLRSKRSVGKDTGAIGRDVFRQILRVQLRVSEADFWATVRSGKPAARPSAPPPPAPGLPAWLAERLRLEVGLSEATIARLTEREGDHRPGHAAIPRHRPGRRS
jgi:hypothetical protein